MQITTIIPFFNNFEEVKLCILSLKKSKGVTHRILLVDGKCTDDTPARLKESFPDIEILGGEKERFWTACTNLGISHAIGHGAEAVLFLNSDNEVMPDTLRHLVDFSKTHPNNIVASKVVDKQTNQILYAGRIPKWRMMTFSEDQFRDNQSIPESGYQTNTTGGQGVLVPISILEKIGLPDQQSFPHYAADTDFCLRAKAKGIKVWVQPRAVVYNQKKSGQAFVDSLPPLKQFIFRIFDIRSLYNLKEIWALEIRHRGRPVFAIIYALCICGAVSFSPGLLKFAVETYKKIKGKPLPREDHFPDGNARRIALLRLYDITFDSRVKRTLTALLADGYQVSVLAPSSEIGSLLEQNDNLTFIPIHLRTRSRVNAGWINKSAQYIEYTFRALSYLSKWKADVVHCHDLETLPMGVIAKYLFRSKVVYDSHELWTGYDFHPWILRFYWFLETLLIPKCAGVICTTDVHATILSETYKIPLPTVIWNSPNPCLPKENRSLLNLLEPKYKKLVADNNLKLLAHIGCIGPARGTDILIKAMEHVSAGVLVFIGPNLETRRIFAALVEKLNLTDRVTFIAPVPPEDVVPIVATSYIGVVNDQKRNLHPYYNGPNKFFEALMAGIPVVVSDFPVMGRLVKEFSIGEVVDEKSPESVAKGINRLIDDHDFYQMSKKNVLKFQKIYSWDRQQERYHLFYSSIFQSDDPAASDILPLASAK